MKRIKFLIIAVTIIFFAQASLAQNTPLSSRKGETRLGIGSGLPYGGIGFQFSGNIFNHLNLFGGFGYHFIDVGYNVGIIKDFKTRNLTQVFFMGMYGRNAGIIIKGLPEKNKLYTGPSFGFGLKFNNRKREGNFWNLGFLVPIRSQSFESDFTSLEEDSRIVDLKKAMPVLFFVGYHFKGAAKK